MYNIHTYQEEVVILICMQHHILITNLQENV